MVFICHCAEVCLIFRYTKMQCLYVFRTGSLNTALGMGLGLSLVLQFTAFIAEKYRSEMYIVYTI